jgi:hypothetical protein
MLSISFLSLHQPNAAHLTRRLSDEQEVGVQHLAYLTWGSIGCVRKNEFADLWAQDVGVLLDDLEKEALREPIDASLESSQRTWRIERWMSKEASPEMWGSTHRALQPE